MRTKFFEKFGTYYETIMLLGAYFCLWYGNRINLMDQRGYLNGLLQGPFSDAYELLTIDLNGYKNELDKITDNISDYVSCLRPSYKFPFVKKDNIVYYPLPHIMGRAVTESMLYRFTENDGETRSLFGKEVLEEYVCDLVSDSKCYEKVEREHEYKKEHNLRATTEDIMACTNEELLFIECKSSAPSVGLRRFDEKAYRNACDRIVEAVTQLYKNVKFYYREYDGYNPFPEKGIIDEKYCWGIVVLLEESYIDKKTVFDKVAEELRISKESEEYVWVISHIKVMGLFTLEVYSLAGINLIDVLKDEADKNNLDLLVPRYKTDGKVVNVKYRKFCEKMINSLKEIAENSISD